MHDVVQYHLIFSVAHLPLHPCSTDSIVLMDSRDQYVGERSSQGEESVEHVHIGCLQREAALQRQVTRLTRENQKLKMFLNHLLSHSISCNRLLGERYPENADYVLATGEIKEADMATHSLKITWENNNHDYISVVNVFRDSEISLFGGLHRISLCDVECISEDFDHSYSTFKFRYKINTMDVRETHEDYNGFVGDEENVLILRLIVNNWCETDEEKRDIFATLETVEERERYFFGEIKDDYPNVHFEFIDAWLWSAGFCRLIEDMGFVSEIGRWQWTSSEIARGRVNGESDRPGVQMG